MPKDNDTYYFCRVCGLKQSFMPWGEDNKTPAFEICGCCGVQFGHEDCTLSYIKKFREEWLRAGGGWFNPAERPLSWSLEEQMKNIPEEYK